MPAPALIVGLTGGIASGKSTVARLFVARGVPVVDADAVAREVVAPGSAGLAAIQARFGDGVLQPDGHLDRARMRRLVFADDEARRELEAIIHPRVRDAMDRQLSQADAPYAIAMIPLLLETGQAARYDRVLVVDASRESQIERARARDGSSREVIEGILDAQVARDRRLAAADDVIANDAGIEALEAQVARLHEDYLSRAARLRLHSHQ